MSDNQDEIKTLFSNILEKLNQIQETLNKIAVEFSTILENLYPEEEQSTFTTDEPLTPQQPKPNYIN